MGARGPEPESDRLLGLAAGYVLEHGIAGLTLRRLSTAIGSNNRMLLYYFGSKEQLIARALLVASTGFPALSSAISALDGPEPLVDRLNACWAGIAAAENLPFHRLFFEVFGVAAHQPGRFDEFLASVGHDWVNQVAGYLRADGVPPSTAASLARELVALWRGLQFDLLSTGDAGTVAATHAAAAHAFAHRVSAAHGS
jgi:AcrR family transcriptional regulator